MKTFLLASVICLATIIPLEAQQLATDSIQTSGGTLNVTFIGHASLLFTYAGKTIYLDPYGKLADYSELPKADLVLITHEHPDHFDLKALASICTKQTQIILTPICAQTVPTGLIMKNGETKTLQGITITAVPAYNIVHKRPDGVFFHPRGRGNGYVLVFGDTRVYVAGDTENIPEMKNLQNIDYAFLPMNLPYTMTPEMVVAAVDSFHPKVLYPYHYGDTDPQKLRDLLKNRQDVEVRIRNLR